MSPTVSTHNICLCLCHFIFSYTPLLVFFLSLLCLWWSCTTLWSDLCFWTCFINKSDFDLWLWPDPEPSRVVTFSVPPGHGWAVFRGCPPPDRCSSGPGQQGLLLPDEGTSPGKTIRLGKCLLGKREKRCRFSKEGSRFNWISVGERSLNQLGLFWVCEDWTLVRLVKSLFYSPSGTLAYRRYGHRQLRVHVWGDQKIRDWEEGFWQNHLSPAGGRLGACLRTGAPCGFRFVGR